VAKYRIERIPSPTWMRSLIPIIAIFVTFLIASVILLLLKVNPITAFYYLLFSPFTNKMDTIEVLVKATPLLLTGISVVFAFASGYWNIGAEGQLYAGAIAAAWLGMVLKDIPVSLSIALMVLGGFTAGLLWALIPAVLKVRLKVDEVVTTLLLNTVILYIVSALLNGPWRDPISNWPQSPAILPNTVFFRLIPRMRLHFGFIVAVVTLLIVWFILSRTSLGLRMRAVGLGKEGAHFSGIHVNRTMFIAALVSGGIAGLAGVGEVAGIQFHLTDALSSGFGYTGIIVATLGGLNPLGAGVAALFLGLIDTGAQTVSRAMAVPVYLGNIVQDSLLLITLSMFVLQNYRIRKV
jgi:general nucleoside transport system permease protein